MPDIKKKQPPRKRIKEKPKSVPRTLAKQETHQAAAWTGKQIQDAARIVESKENEPESTANSVDIISPPHHNLHVAVPPKGKAIKTPETVAARRKPVVKGGKHPISAKAPRNRNPAAIATQGQKPGNAGPECRTLEIPQKQGRQDARKQIIQKRAARKQAVRQQEPCRASPPQEPASQNIPQAVSSPYRLQKEKQIRQWEPQLKQKESPAKTKAFPAAAARWHQVRSAKSTQAAQAVAKARKQAEVSGKRAAKELSQKALRAILASGKSLVAALGAGGAMALLVVVLVMLVGIPLVSPLGIFFSSGADNEMTLQQAMGILNTELQDRVTEIEQTVAHDDLQQNGQQTPWKEVLTIYSVKVTTDAAHPLEVVTVDQEHLELLRQIFWDMNSVDYATETYTEEVTVEIEDSSGEISEETQTVEKTRLVITISGKTAQQMAEEYGFTAEQLGYVAELLSEEYAEFWTMLSLPGVGSDDIVAVALSQVGNVGGEPYWSWYGYTSRVSWCACFVSWCGDQCGYLDAEILPKFSYCDSGVAWFQERGQWQGRDYIPSPGDIIFFDYDHNGSANHVGIVESCDGSTVYTIEGNASDAVKQLSYMVGYSGIMGYGVPAYP